MTSIKLTGAALVGAHTTVVGDSITITLADPPPSPAVPEAARVKAPLRIGLHPTPGEYTRWLPKLPTPWFTRVFYPVGKGLPTWGGKAISELPAQTIRHVSFKDRVPPAAIVAFLDSIPADVPEVWLTWHHEGDINWAGDVPGYTGYWKLLHDTVAGHPARPKVTLINVHTQYASRYKRQEIDWRHFVLPAFADVDAWDCYRPQQPDVYEAPEALLGLPMAAMREFGVRVHITEYGTHPTSWDLDGTAQAQWYWESCAVMATAGVEAVGFWCNVDGACEYRPIKAKVLEAWTQLMNGYNSR